MYVAAGLDAIGKRQDFAVAEDQASGVGEAVSRTRRVIAAVSVAVGRYGAAGHEGGQKSQKQRNGDGSFR